MTIFASFAHYIIPNLTYKATVILLYVALSGFLIFINTEIDDLKWPWMDILR